MKSQKSGVFLVVVELSLLQYPFRHVDFLHLLRRLLPPALRDRNFSDVAGVASLASTVKSAYHLCDCFEVPEFM